MNKLQEPVLVVDDEADIRDLMEMTLMKMGLHVDTAAGVEEAKDKLDNNDYSLVLTDMRMPDGSGLEVVQYIDELMLDTPVAVITAFGNADQAVEALKAGAFDYLQKPITLSQLRSLVKSAVSGFGKNSATPTLSCFGRAPKKKTGTFHLVITELTDLPASYLQAQLTEQKLDLATPFTYFKTSQRDHLNQSDHEQIFHLPDGTLLETTIGNLVLEIEGQLYTPPAHLPLLDGIYRRHLLETQQVEEKLLTLNDLTDADRIYACNALRGLYELDFQRKDS